MIHLFRLFFSFKKSKTNFVVADSSLKSSEASPLTGALTSAEGMKKKENYFELIEI